jgi:hypothetical protein
VEENYIVILDPIVEFAWGGTEEKPVSSQSPDRHLNPVSPHIGSRSANYSTAPFFRKVMM